jgi:hypothetical protein
MAFGKMVNLFSALGISYISTEFEAMVTDLFRYE